MSLSVWWWAVVEIRIERMVLSEGKKETIKYWNTNYLNLEKGSRTTVLHNTIRIVFSENKKGK